MKHVRIAAVTGLLITAVFFATFSFAGPAVRQYGPFPSTSPDSGTCGNDWAEDSFDRHFKANTTRNADGTYTVIEEFKKGTFVTIGGPSPGGCETNPGGIVADGLTGKMDGSFTIIVTGGTFNAAGTCPTVCTTKGFIAAVYGTATYEIPTYLFHYNANNNGDWKNASADRGGDRGDITGGP